MAVEGLALMQFWAEATGSWIESLSFSMENLPGLTASGVISMNTVVHHLDPIRILARPRRRPFSSGGRLRRAMLKRIRCSGGVFSPMV